MQPAKTDQPEGLPLQDRREGGGVSTRVEEQESKHLLAAAVTVARSCRSQAHQHTIDCRFV